MIKHYSSTLLANDLNMSVRTGSENGSGPDDSASESTGSSSSPIAIAGSSRHGSALLPDPPTPSPQRCTATSPYRTPPTSSSPPPTNHGDGPFTGLVFGVLPDQWEPEILMEAQRMIVVSVGFLLVESRRCTDSQLGGGKVRRPGARVHPPPELLLLPLIYEQRTPGGSLITPLPAGWNNLKFVVTPWIVSCHQLWRRIGYERPILLGLDPSIMTPSGPAVTTSTTALGYRHSAANLMEEMMRLRERHAAEVAALHEQLQLQQVELDKRRTSSAALAEEITENLKGFLRVELERQIQATDTDNFGRYAVKKPSSTNVKNDIDSLDQLSLLPPTPETAGCSRLSKTCENRMPRAPTSADPSPTSLEDKSVALTADISAFFAQTESCYQTSSTSSVDRAERTLSGIRRILFPSQPSKKRASESEESPQPIKKLKSRPYWYRIFG